MIHIELESQLECNYVQNANSKTRVETESAKPSIKKNPDELNDSKQLHSKKKIRRIYIAVETNELFERNEQTYKLFSSIRASIRTF